MHTCITLEYTHAGSELNFFLDLQSLCQIDYSTCMQQVLCSRFVGPCADILEGEWAEVMEKNIMPI
jgi:hypothetical protein